MTSFRIFEQSLHVLGLDAGAGVYFASADSLAGLHVPKFSPETHVLLAGIRTDTVAQIKAVLRAVYPADYGMRWVNASNPEAVESAVFLDDLDNSENIGAETVLFIPAMPRGTSFEQFQEIIAHLRAPDGCPWDKEQTHLSLRKHLLEESYETLDALDAEDPAKMREEFGDLLLQIVLHAQIASEFGEFTMTEVIKGIHDKIVRRHPHVFGDVDVTGVGNVLSNWEKIKAAERKANGEGTKGALDGLPSALPALTQAQEYQDRAARVGFDWPEIDGVLDKVNEEIDEVRHTNNEIELTEELGDLFFALVNLARWKKIDAESALRTANIKFKKRFAHIEQAARQQGKHIQELSLDEMEVFWQEAKKI